MDHAAEKYTNLLVRANNVCLKAISRIRNMSRLASNYFDGIYSNFSTNTGGCHLRARKSSLPYRFQAPFLCSAWLVPQGTDTTTAAPCCSISFHAICVTDAGTRGGELAPLRYKQNYDA